MNIYKTILLIVSITGALIIGVYMLAKEYSFSEKDDVVVSNDESDHSMNYPVSLWVWQSPTSFNEKSTLETIQFLKKENISTVYLRIDEYIDIYESKDTNKEQKIQDFTKKTENFIKVANGEDIEVQALAGAPEWALVDNHYISYRIFDFVNNYNNQRQEATFSGIQFDIEPYGIEGFQKQQQLILSSFLNLAVKLVEKNTSKLKLGFAVPYWFDGESKRALVSWNNGENRGAGLYLMDILTKTEGGYIVLMDYRNFAEGRDGSIDHAKAEMEYAKNLSGDVGIYIGQETDDVQPSKITFFGKDKKYLYSEMKKIEETFSKYKNFKGFAIHELISFKELKSAAGP